MEGTNVEETVRSLEEKARQLKRSRQFEIAEQTIEQALALSPQDDSCLFIKSMILEDCGRLQESLSILKNLIVLSPTNNIYHYHYGRSLYFMGNYKESYEYLQKITNTYRGRLEQPHQYAVRIFAMLVGFIYNPNQNILNMIDSFRNWKPEIKEKLFKNDKIRNDYIFGLVLSRLLQEGMPIPKTIPNYRQIYVLGESHSLPLAWQEIFIHESRFLLVPKLVVGLKAWHFSPNPGNCKELSTLRNHLDSIPSGSTVLITAGEIDCRAGIGIDKAVKHGRYPSEMKALEETISYYMEGLSQISSQKNLTVFVHTIRPPLHPQHAVHSESKQLLAKEKDRVILFNQLLRDSFEKPHNPHLYLLDVYQQICDEEMWLQVEYKSDDTHLNHKYLPYVQQQIRLCLQSNSNSSS